MAVRDDRRGGKLGFQPDEFRLAVHVQVPELSVRAQVVAVGEVVAGTFRASRGRWVFGFFMTTGPGTDVVDRGDYRTLAATIGAGLRTR